VRWLVASLTFVSVILGSAPRIWACSPTVRLAGDRSLIADLTPILASRGIATSGDCPALPVSLEKRGAATVVSTGHADRVDSREVTDVRTAATVIESWVRTDLEAPLLVHRPVADVESPDEIVARLSPAPPPTHRLQLFTLGETSLASDGTTEIGFQVGGCVLVGPACLGGRFRFANLADAPDQWEVVMDREAIDALFDVDLPKHIGPFRLAAGAGVGLGWISTHEEQSPPDSKQTYGLCFEPHATASVSLSRHLALESNLSFAVGQTIHTATATPERLPGDPRFASRLGVGLRFEGP
jgi:hypothetical protein